jgi:KUP system potassium uptake protein
MPETADDFQARLHRGAIPRVPGTMVFLTRSVQRVPRLMIDYAHFAGALPARVLALHVQFEPVARVPEPAHDEVDEVGDGLWHMVSHFGFVEIPDLCSALRNTRALAPPIDVDHAVFIGARDLVVPRSGSSPLRRRSVAVFGFLYRNSAKAVDRFNLPSANVIEIARQIEI